MAAEQFANNAVTTLSVAIGPGDSQITVQSAVGFPTEPQFRIVIDGELMLVTAFAGTQWTVTRGIENTTAASHANGAAVVQVLTAEAVNSLAAPGLCQGRLTLQQGNPVPNFVQDGTTIYFTPYLGNRIGLFDGTQWRSYAFSDSETNLSLSSLSSGFNYDVFCYDNGGTPALELTIWESGTARYPANLLVPQDGVLVRSGALTRRYLGTIRTVTTSSGSVVGEDTFTQRFVWNYYNRQRRLLKRSESAASWTCSSATWRQANGNTANKVEYVIGQPEVAAHVRTQTQGIASNVVVYNSQAEDSTSIPSTDVLGAFTTFISSTWQLLATVRDWFPALGYHYTAWLEKTDGQTATFNDTAPSGLSGWVEG